MKATMVLVTISIAVVCCAQPPETLWTRTYGWGGGGTAYSVQPTADGGFIIAGYTNVVPGTNKDMFVIKTDGSGDTLWTRRYGWEHNDHCYDIHQLPDGGYILGGIVNLDYVSPDVSDYGLVRIDSIGDTLWTKAYRYAEVNELSDIDPTDDGGFILAGFTRGTNTGWYDIYLVRTDENGDTVWTRTFDVSSYDYANSVQQTTDGGYIVGGAIDVQSGNNHQLYLLKLDSNGERLWEQAYGGDSNEYAYSVQQTVDEGYILAGRCGTGYILVKTDDNGDSLWTRTYGGSRAYSVRQAPDGGYIVGGYTRSFGMGEDDFYLVRTDSCGDTLWTKTYGGYSNDKCRSVGLTDDGGYIAAGSGYFGGYQFYVVRMGPDVPSDIPLGNGATVPHIITLYPCYPNPFNAQTTISYEVPISGKVHIKIFNILGHNISTLVDQRVKPGSYSIVWDAEGLSSGIYLCRMEINGFSQTRKILLLK